AGAVMAAATDGAPVPLSKAEYLKRYLSEENGKKRRKRPKPDGKGMRIVDDDDEDWKNVAGKKEDMEEDEDAPVVAEFIDERPEEIRRMEEFRSSNKWKLLGACNGGISMHTRKIWSRVQGNKLGPGKGEGRYFDFATTVLNTEKQQSTSLPEKSIVSCILVPPPPKKKIEKNQLENPSRTRDQNEDSQGSDYSLHATSTTSSGTASRTKTEEISFQKKRIHSPDHSPSRSVRHDSPDLSPLRKCRHDSPDLSPLRKGCQNLPDLSPLRKGCQNLPDLSPPRRGRHASPDLSPPRRGCHDSPDLSPRRGHHNVPDLNRKGEKSSEKSLQLKSRDCSGSSLQKRRRHDSSDTSPPRRKCTTSSEQSPGRNNSHDFVSKTSPAGKKQSISPVGSGKWSNVKGIWFSNFLEREKLMYLVTPFPPKEPKCGSSSVTWSSSMLHIEDQYHQKAQSLQCVLRKMLDSELKCKYSLFKRSNLEESNHRIGPSAPSDKTTAVPRQRGNGGGGIPLIEMVYIRETSPARKKSKPSSSPAGRQRHDSDNDVSPPRRRNCRSPEASLSPPCRGQKASKGRHDSDPDLSPPRASQQKTPDSDLSPPRKNPGGGRRQTEGRWQQGEGMLEGGGVSLSPKMTLQLETKHICSDRQLNRLLAVESRDSETIFRDKSGRKRDLKQEQIEKQRKDKEKAEKDEKYAQWGKGLAQGEQQQKNLEDALKEMQKPLARHIDDEDLDRMLREQERDGDPMAGLLRKKKEKESKAQNEKPRYKGPAPPLNRFNIWPGHRWDGVDRSNGFEQQRFARIADKKAVQEVAYKWSVEDM
uniref:BUD13 homolog n=1 Tax=Latimeria chalumnae TaxID=7897 RepID=H3B3S2_LATCH